MKEPIEDGILAAPHDLISPRDVAEMLDVSLQTVYIYIRRGILRAEKKRGTRWLVYLADVEKMIKGDIDCSKVRQ
jgi:excisionase family DNA binding protein